MTRFQIKHSGNNGDGLDPPKSLSQVLLPHLSKPSLCLVSFVLLVLIHGINILESLMSSYYSDDGDYDSPQGESLLLLITNSLSSLEIGQQDGYHNETNSVQPNAQVSSIMALLLRQPVLVAPRPASAIFLLLALITALLVLQYTRLSKIIATTSSIPGIPSVPDAHPYMGHYSYLYSLDKHTFLFRQFATPSGISAMWGPGLKRCASVLLARHARLVLRHNSHRDFNDWIIRHGRKTLGEDSIILISGGQRWKNVRKVVAKAFASRIVKDGRRVTAGCASELVDWLAKACEEGPSDGTCRAHGVIDEGKGTVRLEAEHFFKLFSLNVFGRVAMGHDFQCVPTSSDGHANNNNSSDNDNINSGSQPSSAGNKQRSRCATCSCLPIPAVAKAFEFLGNDIGIRATTKSFFNPAMQCYSIPTKHNKQYHANMKLVSGLMGRIIGRELDRKLRSMRSALQRSEPSKTEMSSSDDDTHDLTDNESEQEEDLSENMVTHLIQSCMEQHFSESSSSGQSPSGCPFATSSSSHSHVETPSGGSRSNIPPPSQITDADKNKIIQDVTKTLHTLLVAGYETTAISLSYVMYFLSKNPRCQDRCSEEARRVLGNNQEGGNSGQKQQPQETMDDDLLPYCRAVFTESLRIQLPVMFTTRVISKDLTLDSGNDDGDTCTLLKGTRVFINPSMIHLDERNYERASEFIPERWVRWDEAEGRWLDRDHVAEEKRAEESVHRDSSPTRPRTTPPSPFSDEYDDEHAHADTVSAADPANYFSFSDGARNCVGQRLAIMESTILIATLLRDICVGLAEGPDFELVNKRIFVTVKPTSLPLVFWKR